jgi:hypothetical protein
LSHTWSICSSVALGNIEMIIEGSLAKKPAMRRAF